METGRLVSSAAISAEVPVPTVFFDIVLGVFNQAIKASGDPVDLFYSIGGYVVRLSFASRTMVPLITSALKHLATGPVSSPDLTVCLWDSVSTGTDMPPPPWSAGDYSVRGEIRGFNNDYIHTTFNPGSGVLNMLDARRNIAHYWVRDAAQLPYYEKGAPLLTILYWWMRRRGRQLVHAAAVGRREGGVLLVGKGGSGKSSTALACINSGLTYAGDDYCMVSADPAPYVYSVFSSGKVNAKDMEKMPFLKACLSNSRNLGREKALFFLSDIFPEKISYGFPVKAILLPRVTGLPETRLKKTSVAAGLTALAPSTIFQLPGAGREAFENLSGFVRQLPSYVLELGTEQAGITDAITGLISELCS